jgi:hypothetical protein
MAERLPQRLRPIGMRKWAFALVLAVPLLLTGCGDSDNSDTGADPGDEASLACTSRADAPEIHVDVDGDGTADSVRVDGAALDGSCQDAVVADVGGHEVAAPLEYGLPVSSGDLAGVRLPGRSGDLVLITAQHPRGGFQAALFGYADGELAELTVDGASVFPFVATDTNSTPLAARCVDGGFEVTQARAHEPVGVVPAWDVDRTTYTVAGNTVTGGTTTEVADNVLDKQLRSRYGNLVEHALFEDCRSGS